MKLQGRRWHLWSFLAGCAVLGVLLVRPSGAQEDEPKKTGTKKEQPKKTVDPVKKAPEIKDVVVGATGGIENIKVINETLEKAWNDNKLVPSERCSDYEFIRRASLDIIGRIAKVHEIGAQGPAERRRSMLIERLMAWRRAPRHLCRRIRGQLGRHLDGLHDPFGQRQALPNGCGIGGDKLIEGRPSPAMIATGDWSKIVTELLTAEGNQREQRVCYILAHLGGSRRRQAKAANGAFDAGAGRRATACSSDFAPQSCSATTIRSDDGASTISGASTLPVRSRAPG